MIKIYTDGSCLNNPGDGGWAAIINDDGETFKISGSEKRKREGADKDYASGERNVEARTGKRRKKESSGDAGVLGADRVLRERSKRKRVTTESSSGGEEDDNEGGHNRAKKPSL